MSGVVSYKPEITHCIWDLDGLILGGFVPWFKFNNFQVEILTKKYLTKEFHPIPDTETLAFKVTQKILNDLTNNSKKHSWEVKESLLGLSADDVAKRVVQVYDLPVPWQEYQAMAKEEAQNLMKNCEMFEGEEQTRQVFSKISNFYLLRCWTSHLSPLH